MLKTPPGEAFVLRLFCAAEAAAAIVDRLLDNFESSDIAVAAFEEAAADCHARPWLVEAYFSAAPDEALLRALVAKAAGEDAAKAVHVARIAPRDWVAQSLEGLAPVRAGRFLVHGSHERDIVGAHQIGIEIEAALAFGTGHHGSTRGCLAVIGRIAKRRRPRRVLDVGTGTGILAIAAARLFHVPVKAGDSDAVAVATAKANVHRNRAASFVSIVQAQGVEHPELKKSGRYDLVVANILALPLKKLAPALVRVAAPGADIILSGLLPSDVPGVVSAYGAQNTALVARLDIEGWTTLHMRKPPRLGRKAAG